ncbi:MAG: transposase [Arcicella sp.]|nr:transposase [Arcicella sp.]
MNQHYIQFFTATNLWWKKLLQPDKYKQIIIDSLKFLVENEGVKVYGFVIMPNHVHLIWKINENHKREDVQRDFLKFTAQRIKQDLETNHPAVLAHFEVNLKDRKYQFWERNPLSVDLYSRKIVYQKLTYIHYNPLQDKWQLVEKPEDYWFSSYRFYEFGIDDFGFLTHYLEDC